MTASEKTQMMSIIKALTNRLELSDKEIDSLLGQVNIEPSEYRDFLAETPEAETSEA